MARKTLTKEEASWLRKHEKSINQDYVGAKSTECLMCQLGGKEIEESYTDISMSDLFSHFQQDEDVLADYDFLEKIERAVLALRYCENYSLRQIAAMIETKVFLNGKVVSRSPAHLHMVQGIISRAKRKIKNHVFVVDTSCQSGTV